MELLSKIKLSWRFGRMIYLISAILSVTMAALVVYRPLTIPFCFLVKVLSIPVIYYLNLSMTKGLGIYFYLNLGISRKEYRSVPFVLDFILFILLMTIAGVTGYGIR